MVAAVHAMPVLAALPALPVLPVLAATGLVPSDVPPESSTWGPVLLVAVVFIAIGAVIYAIGRVMKPSRGANEAADAADAAPSDENPLPPDSDPTYGRDPQ